VTAYSRWSGLSQSQPESIAFQDTRGGCGIN
jgi:hypothetical protein